MIYCFDIDGTICHTDGSNYEGSTPFPEMVTVINSLYDQGHTIKMFTARGSVSGKDWTDLTTQQLDDWGVKHHELIMNTKPHYDLLVDDKTVNVEDFRRCMIPKET